ncbi:hypothetical protein Desgi_0705 [Desulfoscipio gibsoniae DSM 7213]|uniref:Uncharacterized protein n=1 Tax=Desulfoscipio gibsoniae DSM 7213 TaxID=767817 RepID=R4KIA3_9FIRM|nr:hypothetical protein Desgi_0705 [Desulfoscipio gibsoniae DSM 7213]
MNEAGDAGYDEFLIFAEEGADQPVTGKVVQEFNFKE